MTFVTTDLCIGFFQACWDQHLIEFPPHAAILELGCAEGDWISPMLAERPDLEITGIDWRGIHRPGAKAIVQGDILITQKFTPASFDAVVAVSSLEHIGLGAYGDPLDPDGDTKTVQRVAEWLKPGGTFYFDVPHRPNGPYEVHKNFRAYDDAALKARLFTAAPSLKVINRALMQAPHADGPFISVVMRKV